MKQYSAELWMDEEGYANFKWHIEGGDFLDAREVLVKYISCLQSRLDKEHKCPFYKKDKAALLLCE